MLASVSMRLMHITTAFRPPEKFVTCVVSFSVRSLKPDVPDSTPKLTLNVAIDCDDSRTTAFPNTSAVWPAHPRS